MNIGDHRVGQVGFRISVRSDPAGGGRTSPTLDATAISSSIGVRIQGLDARPVGMGLDNLVLTATTAEVPEPATVALLLAGPGLMGRQGHRCLG